MRHSGSERRQGSAHPLGVAALLAAALLVCASPARGTGAGPSPSEIGRDLYFHGSTPSGTPIQGTVQGDIPVNGAVLACSNCHRRSGLGSSEGGNLVPPVTGSALYTAREKHQREWPTPGGNNTAIRPAYTDASLRRALREGIDAAGRPLDPLMPRYALDDAQIDALIAYLKTLGAEPAPGITGKMLHLATIVTPGADAARRATMLQVLEAFFDDKNALTRNEAQRAARAPWHLDWKLSAYRKIQLHVWTLEGQVESWRAQLDTLYAAQPVFAVVSGIGADDWRPVHAFCEAQALPCLFPNTLLPDVKGNDFYSVYFSQGMTLEAHVAARFLHDAGLASGPVIQLIADDASARTAADALRQALPVEPVELRLSASVTPSELTAWHGLSRQLRPGAVVFWGSRAQLQTLLSGIGAPDGGSPVMLASASLTDMEPPLPVRHARLHWIHPYALTQPRAGGPARVRAWLRSRGLEVRDMPTAMNTYFAATITTGAINMLLNRFSREYLIERIEHGTENALVSGAYARLSLGPNQRFASKGAYVVPHADGRINPTEAVWVVP